MFYSSTAVTVFFFICLSSVVFSSLQVHDTLDKVKDFSERVRSGELKGATGKHLTNIVAVGIGGSYLGPEFVHEVNYEKRRLCWGGWGRRSCSW